MGILKYIFAKKEEPKPIRHKFDNADRLLSMQGRQLDAEMKFLHKKKQILELKSMVDELREDFQDEEPDSDNDSVNGLIMKFLSQIMNKNTQSTPTSLQSSLSNFGTAEPKISEGMITLSDDSLRDLISQVMPAKYKKQAKKMQESSLVELVRIQYPRFTDDTIRRAVKILQEG